VRPDGSSRPATEAAGKFWATVRPCAAELRTAFPEPARIGIWRSRKNEVFHLGRGTVFYCGTNLAQAAERDPTGLNIVLGIAKEPYEDIRERTAKSETG
jgi:hypothetical protein